MCALPQIRGDRDNRQGDPKRCASPWRGRGFDNSIVGIDHLADADAEDLSYGQRKLLEFASAMMPDPRIVLLDEPAGGVNPTLLEKIIDRIRALRERGVTFLIVEHNMDMVMKLSDSVVVMAHGAVLMQSDPVRVQNDPTVLDAYLGKV